MAERQVDDPDAGTRALCSIAQSIASMTSLVSPDAVGAEHLQADEVRARRDARVAAVAVARDDARDVRAVAEPVARRRPSAS